MLFLGIDPGATGAISVFDEHEFVKVYKMPDTVHDFVALIEQQMDADPTAFAMVEEIVGPAHTMSGLPARASWTFGRNCGVVYGVLAGVRLPHELILSVRWQKLMGCRKVNGKKTSKMVMQGLYPHAPINESNADAIALGELCRRLKTGQTVPGA